MMLSEDSTKILDKIVFKISFCYHIAEHHMDTHNQGFPETLMK